MKRAYKEIRKDEFEYFFKRCYYGFEIPKKTYDYLENSEEMKKFWKEKDVDSELKEYIYLILLTDDYGIIVYSSVDKRTNLSRDCDRDAIRLVVVDFDRLEPIRKSRKVLRIETWRKNFIKNTDEMIAGLGNDMKCESCGAKMTLKGSRKTKKNFLGCEKFVKNKCATRNIMIKNNFA